AGQFPQLAAVGPDHEEYAADVVAAALGLVGLFRDVDQDPAAAQDRPGPAGGGPAHQVDHHVHVADVVLEPAGVVENLVGAEPGDEIPVPRRRGSGHPRAVLGRELRDVGADTAGAAVDQDVLPGSQLSVLVQRLPGGERAERNGGSGQMIHGSGLGGQVGGGGGDVLGGGAGAVEADQAVDLVAGLPAVG